MEISPLSKRGLTIFKRYVEMNFDRVLGQAKKAKRKPHSGINRIKINNWIITLDYYMGFHADDCENEGERILFDERCDCDYQEVQMEIEVSYEYDSKKNDLLIDSLLLDASVATKENMYEFLDKIQEKKEWTMCPCRSVAKKDGLCKECYIHSYERTEEEGGNCAICYENNGRWTKLQCGHIFHTYCINNLDNVPLKGWTIKCPLCRSECFIGYDNKKVIRDCYDV
jgi:hypothetical protein